MTPRNFGAVALGCLLSLTGCGNEETDAAEPLTDTGITAITISCPTTPAVLAPPATQNLVFKYHAVGVQIYDCKIPTGKVAYEWAFREPRADLFNAAGELVGTHFAGPIWQHSDGSAVTGKKVSEAPGATANDIPLLKLSTTNAAEDTVGKFSDVTWIQRLTTVGGVAPRTACSATNSGEVTEVSYTADYYFYRANPGQESTNLRCGG